MVDAIQQLTDGGADYGFECIGNTQVMRQALECTHKGWGRTDVPKIVDWLMDGKINIDDLIRRRFGWHASTFGLRSRSPALAFDASGRTGQTEQYCDLITHRLKLDDINQGFELMKSGESIRSVVMYRSLQGAAAHPGQSSIERSCNLVTITRPRAFGGAHFPVSPCCFFKRSDGVPRPISGRRPTTPLERETP